ncbi:hypothetical protein DPMN_099285 [Dreissena polymorpha]|uniref:Uncharacterized protein n=1 Tax=Dreissena polymorpha TaxID=45954 RepID=A0A9D4LG67_DREPO|nr:hypothetical protein DPMN_099285 [Dreissena polymorpha]
MQPELIQVNWSSDEELVQVRWSDSDSGDPVNCSMTTLQDITGSADCAMTDSEQVQRDEEYLDIWDSDESLMFLSSTDSEHDIEQVLAKPKKKTEHRYIQSKYSTTLREILSGFFEILACAFV